MAIHFLQYRFVLLHLFVDFYQVLILVFLNHHKTFQLRNTGQDENCYY